MAESRFALAEVRLWGRTVGAVTEDDAGRVVFEYDPAFRRSGLEISPRNLPLSLTGPVSFDELRRKESFQGLPGVLADALPDAEYVEIAGSGHMTPLEQPEAFNRTLLDWLTSLGA